MIPIESELVKLEIRFLQENGHIPSGKLTFCNGKPPFFIGDTSSFMVDFPASYVSLPEGRWWSLLLGAFQDLQQFNLTLPNGVISVNLRVRRQD